MELYQPLMGTLAVLGDWLQALQYAWIAISHRTDEQESQDNNPLRIRVFLSEGSFGELCH